MWHCKTYRGDLAAALYEPLEAEAQARLDAHLAQCAACRAEDQALRAFVDAIPSNGAAFEGDLLPALREELRHTAPGTRRFAWGILAPVTVAVAAAVVAVFTLLAPEEPPAPSRQITLSPPVDLAVPARAIAGAARTLAASNNFVAAQGLLTNALENEVPAAGTLRLALADIEFEHGQRYAEAYGAYQTLKRDFPAVWAASPAETKDRFDLLSEVRGDNFDPLYRLDAVHTFEQLEKILALSPERQMLASLAVARMAEIIQAEGAPDTGIRVAALEAVRARCTEPLAVAQLSIALGDVYWKELKDPLRARPHYEEAASATHLALAQRAEAALSELDALARP